MARTSVHAINSDWDYTVEKVPVFDENGKAIKGQFMNRRQDNGQVLKVGVSKDYNVVNNRDIVNPVQDVLAELGLEPTEVKHYVMGGGKSLKSGTLWGSVWIWIIPSTFGIASKRWAAVFVWFAPTG